MREEYDFSRAKPASEIPVLVNLHADTKARKNSKTRVSASASGESGVAKKRKIKIYESVTDFHPA
jgi:hypothetical protein